MNTDKTLIFNTTNTNLTEGTSPSNIKWPEADVKRLQEYCGKMGIVGFNSGCMPPLVALALLKQQLGDESVEEGVKPRESYMDAIKKKQILHG